MHNHKRHNVLLSALLSNVIYNVGEKTNALAKGQALICQNYAKTSSMVNILLYAAGRRNRASVLIGFVFLGE